MSTLTTIRTSLLALLGDTTNTFDATTLDESIRTALGLINTVTGSPKQTTLTLSTNAREFSIAALGQATITELWLPYDPANFFEDQPNIRAFDVLPNQTLRITDSPTPQANQVARIFYTVPHTLAGLDEATETTLDNTAPLIAGSAAYAILVRLRKIAETVRSNPKAATELANLQARYSLVFESWLTTQRTRATGSFLEW